MAQTDIGTTVSGYSFSTNPSPGSPGFEHGGNLYAFLIDDAHPGHGEDGSDKLHCFKSTDSGATWTEQDSGNAPSLGNVSTFGAAYCVCRDGDTAYTLWVRAHHIVAPLGDQDVFVDGITVKTFNLSSDTWGSATNYASPVVDFMQKNAAFPTSYSRQVQLNLVRRGAGDMIFVYSGPVEANPGFTGYARVYCATFDGSSFGTETQIPGQAGSGHYYMLSGACVDGFGITRINYLDPLTFTFQGTTVWQIAMDSGGGFGAAQTVISTEHYLNDDLSSISSPVVFTDNGTEYIAFADLINDDLSSTTQSIRLFYAPTVNGTGALTWADSTVSTAVYGDNTPNLPVNQTFYLIAVDLAVTYSSGFVTVAWTFTDSGTSLGTFYYSIATFQALSWAAPAIIVSSPASPSPLGEPYTAYQIASFPFTNGIAFLTVSVTDVTEETAQANALVVSSPLTISCDSPPDGEVGVAYTHTFPASGGTPPYTFSITSGALPTGLSLDTSTGIVSGTPSAAGTFPFTIQVEDDASATSSVDCSITIFALTANCNNPPQGTVGVAYSHTLTASGGTPPYTWAIISGSLPNGLSLNPSTGEISGTPTFAAVFSFTAEVTDSLAQTGQVNCSITIVSTQQTASVQCSISISPALGMSCGNPPPGAVAVAYNSSLIVTGGVPPYTFALTAGSLPPGLSLNPSSGAILGTPTQTGFFVFTVQVTDSASSTAAVQCIITILGSSSGNCPDAPEFS